MAWKLVVPLAALLAGCASSDDPDAPAAGGTSPAAVDALDTGAAPVVASSLPTVGKEVALDGSGLGDVMRRARFAFRAAAEPGAFEGGHGTLHVQWASEPVPQARIRSWVYPAEAFDPSLRGMKGAWQHALPGESWQEAEQRLREGMKPRPGHEIRVSTRSVRRGGSELLAGRPEVALDDDGAIVADSGMVEELWRNREAGVEQSWRFERKPAGSGDLVVRVRLEGLELATATAAGLHFAPRGEQGGFLYGKGTWIDARGVRFGVTPSFDAGEVVLRVPSSVLDASEFPAVLDPIIGAELSVDTPSLAPSTGGQSSPAVSYASNLGKWLAVWTDDRNPVTGKDIFGAAVDPVTGLASPRAGMVVSNAAGDQDYPAVAYAAGAQTFGVVWADRRGSSTDIYAARIAASTMTLADANGIAISTHSSDAVSPTISFLPGHFLVAWSDSRNGNSDIFARRFVPGTGVLENASDVAIAAGAGNQGQPAITYDTGPGNYTASFVMVYADDAAGNSNIMARAINPNDLTTVGPTVITNAPGDQTWPAIAYSGNDDPANPNMVVWVDYQSDPGYATGGDIKAAIFDVSAQTVGTVRTIAANAGVVQTHPRVSLAAVGLITWQDARNGGPQIYGNRIDPFTAVPYDGNGFAITTAGGTSEYSQGQDCGGGTIGCLVAWQDERNESKGAGTEIYGARVLEQNVGAQFIISEAGDAQQNAAVAFDGTDWLVVWEDYKGSANQWDIYGARVSGSTGAVIGSSFVVSAAAKDQRFPDVAFDGTNYLVVWEDARNDAAGVVRDIYGQRVSKAGAMVGANFAVSNNPEDQHSPAIAWGPAPLPTTSSYGRIRAPHVPATGACTAPGSPAAARWWRARSTASW